MGFEGVASGLIGAEKALAICDDLGGEDGSGLGEVHAPGRKGRKLLRKPPCFHRRDGPWADRGAASVPLRRMLFASGWSLPHLRMLLCRATLPAGSPLGRLAAFRVPEWLTLVDWSALSAAELASLAARQAADGLLTPDLDPLAEGFEIESRCSVGAIVDGRIAGWMIAERAGPRALRYAKLYVEPELQGTGRALHLLAEAVRRHTALAAEYPHAVFATRVQNEAIYRLLVRYFVPLCDKAWHTFSSYKRLCSSPSLG